MEENGLAAKPNAGQIAVLEKAGQLQMMNNRKDESK
jgi:hypothetical protein